jgi:glycosyltransferase involved in cell wall biosynthesis
MPRVLLLCEYPTLNGGERSMLATLDGLAQAGFSVAVASPDAGPLYDALCERGIQVVPLAACDEAGDRFSQSQRRERLDQILAEHRPDLVHANSLSMGRLSGPVVASRRIPSIGHLRDIIRLGRRAIADLNAHSRLLAVSRATRDWHVAAGLDRSKVHVLHNGVDLVEFRPNAPSGYLHRELQLPSDAKLIGAIGQIGLRKGLDTLLLAAGDVLAKCPEACFVVAGQRNSTKDESREFERKLHDAAAAMAGRFRFLGYRDDVPQLFAEWTLLVHSARQEPLGRVLLEAAASGTPTIATDVGGTAEIFPPECNAAILIPPDDPAALAAAMLQLLGDEPRRRRLAMAARRRAETAFDAAHAAAALANHYGEVLAGR